MRNINSILGIFALVLLRCTYYSWSCLLLHIRIADTVSGVVCSCHWQPRVNIKYNDSNDFGGSRAGGRWAQRWEPWICHEQIKQNAQDLHRVHGFPDVHPSVYWSSQQDLLQPPDYWQSQLNYILLIIHKTVPALYPPICQHCITWINESFITSISVVEIISSIDYLEYIVSRVYSISSIDYLEYIVSWVSSISSI